MLPDPKPTTMAGSLVCLTRQVMVCEQGYAAGGSCPKDVTAMAVPLKGSGLQILAAHHSSPCAIAGRDGMGPPALQPPAWLHASTLSSSLLCKALPPGTVKHKGNKAVGETGIPDLMCSLAKASQRKGPAAVWFSFCNSVATGKSLKQDQAGGTKHEWMGGWIECTKPQNNSCNTPLACWQVVAGMRI